MSIKQPFFSGRMACNTRKRKNLPSTNKRECGCISHKQLIENSTPKRLYTIANRGFETSHKQCLVDRDLLSEGCQYVCDICLEHGEYLLHGFVASKQVPPAPAVTGAENDTGPIPTTQCDEESELESVIDSLILKLRRKQNHTVVVEQKLNTLLQVIGNKIINPSLKSDTDKFQKLYQTAGTLSDLKSNEFIGNCNNMMVNFLCAVTGRRIDSMDNLLLYTFSVCL